MTAGRLRADEIVDSIKLDDSTFYDDVEELLKEGSGLEVRNLGGWSLLEGAVDQTDEAKGSVEKVALLIEKGADVNARGNYDMTPLMRAAQWSTDPEIIKLLLDKGADIEARDVFGETTLMHAAILFETTEIVKLLLDKGADIEARCEDGWTPLMYAANSDDSRAPETVKMLIEAGADVNAKCDRAEDPEDYHQTPLRLAFKSDEIKELLKDAGARE